MNGPNRNQILSLIAEVNKQLVADGGKDRLREQLNARLQASGLRAQMENSIRTLVQESGGVDQVSVHNLVSQMKESSANNPAFQAIIGAIRSDLAQGTANQLIQRAHQPPSAP